MDDKFIRSLAIDWDQVERDSYLRSIPALRRTETLEFGSSVTVLVGENGTGKSTLLEAIAVAYGFNLEGGPASYRFSTYDDVSGLSRAIQLARGWRRARTGYFFRAESFFNLASKAEEYRQGDPKEVFYRRYGGKSLHEQSHGESFLAWFQSFDQEGLYLMDEPEAALSPQRQLTLLLQMVRMARQGSQFILASHSPILQGIPGAQLLSFDGGAITPCAWEDTESYQVTRLFLERREQLLEELLK